MELMTIKTKQQIESEIARLQEKLKTFKKTIVINNVEYELEQHDHDKKLSEIIIPKGWRLLLPSEAMMLYERGLIDDTFWFYIEQTNKEEKAKGNVARFGANSSRAGLYCGWDSAFTFSGLGVLFCREVEK